MGFQRVGTLWPGIWGRRPQAAPKVKHHRNLRQSLRWHNMTHIHVYTLVERYFPMQIEKNKQTLLAHLEEAIDRRSQKEGGKRRILIHTSEMSLTAYDCADLFQIDPKHLNSRIESALKEIIAATKDKNAALTVGFPFYTVDGDRVILHALIADGQIIAVKGKEELANNIGQLRGVEYEPRYFIPCVEGTAIQLFDKRHTYKKGKRARESLFSDSPALIEGERVAIAICEEIWIGLDHLDVLEKELDQLADRALMLYLKSAAPEYRMLPDQYCTLKNYLNTRLSGEKPPFPAWIQNGDHARLEKLFESGFESFRQEWMRVKNEGIRRVQNEIRQKNALYCQLKQSDIVLIPNGSPSACFKCNRRENRLKLIAETYRKDCRPICQPKRFYYNNCIGTPGGSIDFDGTAIAGIISEEEVSIRYLSLYNEGLIDGEANQCAPHWTTAEGQKKIARIINGTEYYSGKNRFKIAFGEQVSDFFPTFYQQTDYAYSNLLKHLESFHDPQEHLLKIGNRRYWGHFIALSGGFDSAHTIVIRAKAVELRMRSLIKKSDTKEAVQQIAKELKLNRRSFDLNAFCLRFLTQLSIEKKGNNGAGTSYGNLDLVSQCMRIAPEKLSTLDCQIEAVKEEIEKRNWKTIADVLNGFYAQTASAPIAQDEQIHFLSKLIVFHVIKACYLRTDNNSIGTERAARLLAFELGADFEVQSIDADFKIALLAAKGIDLLKYDERERIAILQKYGEILAIPSLNERLERIEELKSEKEILLHIHSHAPPFEAIAAIDTKIEALTTQIEKDKQKIADLKSTLCQQLSKNTSRFCQENQSDFSVHNWFESPSGIEIENIQARVRAVKNWEIAYQCGLMPTSNPNADEAKLGYTTYMGDLHAGEESSTGNLTKIQILAELAVFMGTPIEDESQFTGAIRPLLSLKHTFAQPPSAELQQIGQLPTFSQQTDEESYGMSYFELSLIGDALFELSENRAHFLRISQVYERFKAHPLFYGHDAWQIYCKLDKVYRQWFFTAFKRRASPWQMSNSDAAVDHHINNRTEFSGYENAVRFERAELLLTVLVDKGIVIPKNLGYAGFEELKRNLLLNRRFQEKLQSVIWSHNDPKEISTLIKRYVKAPLLLEKKIRERLGVIEQATLAIAEPALTTETNFDFQRDKNAHSIQAAPIHCRARDMAGNVYQAKEAIAAAFCRGKAIVVIPDLLGADLGDNLRRVHQTQIDWMLEEIAQFAYSIAPHLTVIAGTAFYDEQTEDRSRRYYQAACVIRNGKNKGMFFANQIANNGNRPGACYDTRTFQPYCKPQFPIAIDGKRYFVLVGASRLPAEFEDADLVIVHLGAMEAQSQIEAFYRLPPSKRMLSVNAFGNPSGLRGFNGRVIAHPQRQKMSFDSSNIVEEDAQWLNDYLPLFGKTAIKLDSPEALYSLAVMKKRIELKTKAPCDAKSFQEHVTIISIEDDASSCNKHHSLYQAAAEITGFELSKSHLKQPKKGCPLEGFYALFVRNTLVGDLNVFQNICEEDSWILFDAHLRTFLQNKSQINHQHAATLHYFLSNSALFKDSLAKTYAREQESLFHRGKSSLEAFIQKEIATIIARISHYKAHAETKDRLEAVFCWLLSASQGGEIILGNIARNDLCCSEKNLFGGSLHAGGVSVTASRSLKEMRAAMPLKAVTARALFCAKMKEEIVSGLTREEVDAIFESLKDSDFDVDSARNSKIFQGKSPKETTEKLRRFAIQWEKNIWDRHAIPNGPHVKYSLDQQTTFREPLRGSSWLIDQMKH